VTSPPAPSSGTAARRGVLGAGGRFVVTGLLVLPLSLGLHLLATGAGLDVHASRVASYVVGTVLVSVVNQLWTFRAPGVRGAAGWVVLLYAVTFVVVIATHALALAVLPAIVAAPWVVAAAWFVSQGLGTTVNFAVLRGLVFR
jgi:putative flippase GtrA